MCRDPFKKLSKLRFVQKLVLFFFVLSGLFLWSLSFEANGAEVQKDGKEEASFEDFIFGEVKKWKQATWFEPLAKIWRQEHINLYIRGYLFRKEPDLRGEDKSSQTGLGADLSSMSKSGGYRQPRQQNQEICHIGDNYLALGLLPEAIMQYNEITMNEKSDIEERICAEFGLVKTNIAMGRLEEAKEAFNRLAKRKYLHQKPIFILLDGMLSFFDGNIERASRLFTEQGAYWYLCPNVDSLAAFSLLVKKRYTDAANVFQRVKESSWRDIQAFGTLGLADALLGQRVSEQAEELAVYLSKDPSLIPRDMNDLGEESELRKKKGEKKEKQIKSLYFYLVGEGSALGLLGLAELSLIQREEEQAVKYLRRIIDSDNMECCKSIAFIYLLTLRQEEKKWGESLLISEESQVITFDKYWDKHRLQLTVRSLEHVIKELLEKKQYKELLLLLAKWRRYEPFLSSGVQIDIAKAYEQLKIIPPAIRIYDQYATTPEAYFYSARLAWFYQRYNEADAFLAKYHKTPSGIFTNEARLLGACLLYHRNKHEAAKKLLNSGSHETQDTALLIDTGKVEVSLGMLTEAVRDFQAALQGELISQEDRQFLRYAIAELLYRQGKYAEAVSYLRPEDDEDLPKQGGVPDPLEIMCLLNLKKAKEAKQLSTRLGEGQGAVTAKEAVAIDELLGVLRKEGYDF